MEKILLKIITLITLLILSESIFASEWYEGGTLTDKNALAWQEASLANKIASAGDFVAVIFQSQLLVSSISSKIKGVNDLAPYSIQLAECINQAVAKNSDPEENKRIFINQKVNEIGAVCSGLMG
jgi:hypothetical protein